MSRFNESYSRAIHATSLKSVPESTFSATDTLGAAGLAARHEGLGIALSRVFHGGGGTTEAVEAMAEAVFDRSRYISRHTNYRLTEVQARDLARSVFAWYRHGTCQPCGGIGYTRIKDTPSLGSRCHYCDGTGRLIFVKMFQHRHRELAEWLQDSIGLALSRASQLAEIKRC